MFSLLFSSPSNLTYKQKQFHEVPRVDKFTETKAQQKLPEVKGEAKEELMFNTEFLFGMMKEIVVIIAQQCECASCH